jgi:hypothetical protein
VTESVREILVKSLGDRVRGERENDLVDRLAVQDLLDRVHGVVPDRYGGDDVATGGGLQGWKGTKQVVLGLVGLGMPLGV